LKLLHKVIGSVADPDLVLFDPWIRDPGLKKVQIQDPGSMMNIPGNIFFENLVLIFGLKILEFFDADPDPRSGINIPDQQYWLLVVF
jgi:hypothetical protein